VRGKKIAKVIVTNSHYILDTDVRIGFPIIWISRHLPKTVVAPSILL